jgi:signal transduction histidine kinase
VYSLEGIWEWEHFIIFNRVSNYLKNWIFFALVFLIARKNISNNVWKILFVVLLVTNWECIQGSLYAYSSRLVFSFFVKFYHFAELSVILTADIIVQMIIIIILFLVFAWVFYRFLKPHLNMTDPGVIKKLCVIPVLFYVLYNINLEIHYHYDSSVVMRNFTVFLILIFALTSVYFFVMLFRMYHNISKTKQVEQQLKMQDEHYTALQEYVADARRIRHDMRQHLSVFMSYIDTGKTDNLVEYINEYKKTIPDSVDVLYCENHAVNAILYHYIGRAKSENINVDVHTELPKNCGINDIDLCIVFGNSLENAIEAAQKLLNNRFIKICSKITGNLLTIVIENNFDNIVKKDGDEFLSLKSGGEGIGTSSIKAIAEKYDGSVQFDTDGSIFRTTVILRLSKD